MTPKVSLRKALEDPQLLGAVLEGPSWHAWRSLLLAAMGEELKPDELKTFKQFTGRKAAPDSRVDELWCVIGRRGGKSRAMAALAIYLPGFCDYKKKLARGEKGIVLLIAPDMKQAKVALDYAEGALESTPLMKQLIVSRTAETLTLTTGITLDVRWGALWDTYRRHYGADGDSGILVAQGASRDFNPELSQSIIDRAMERDPATASAEYLAQFRTDVEGFITREAVEACVSLGVHERPLERAQSYVAFVDPSGGSSDSMTLAIAHTQGKTQLLDAVREIKPPFSPEAVVDEFASLIRSYRCSTVYGDRYGGEWPREQFQKRGVHYEPADKAKSDIYRDLWPLINSGAVDLLDHDRLMLQLTSLERRTSRGGRDSIDHAPGAHDDIANAVAGALVQAYQEPGVLNFRRKLEHQPLGIV